MKLKSYVYMIAGGVFLMASLIYLGLVQVPSQALQYIVVIAIIVAVGVLAYTFVKNRPKGKETLINFRDDMNKFYGPKGMNLDKGGDKFEKESHFFSKFEGLNGDMYGIGILYNEKESDTATVYVKNLDKKDDGLSWDGVDATDLNDIPRFIVSKVFPVLFPRQIRLRAVTAFPKKKKGKEDEPTTVETSLNREEVKQRGEE